MDIETEVRLHIVHRSVRNEFLVRDTIVGANIKWDVVEVCVCMCVCVCVCVGGGIVFGNRQHLPTVIPC